jgi:hypothetical protein
MEYPSALSRGKRAIPFWRGQRAWLAGLLACGLAGGGLGACAGRAADDASRLPVFGPADAILFDDRLVLEPGLENSYRADPRAKLRERVRRADAVLRVRVGSVTRASANQGVVYALVVRRVGPTLAGQFSEAPFTLTVTRDDPGFSAVRQLERRLVAKTLVLFLKRYNGGPRQGTLRWHAEPDSPALHALIQGAARETGSERAR